jgi:CRISPR/Cas system-associated exonuclease Cas4 (RecB family)
VNRLSASGVPRALACPSSLILPRHAFANVDADAGTERHEADEAAIDLGSAEDALPAEVVAMFLPGDKHSTEPSFAYDTATDTARALGNIKRRDYSSLSPYEIAGTPDLVVIGNGRAIVVDHKGFERVQDAEVNAQTLTYALMVARAGGFDEVTVVIYYELGRPDIAVIGSLQLDAHAARLKRLQVDVVRAQQNPDAFLKAGSHCKYCESFFYCKAQQGLVLEVGGVGMPMRIEASIPFEQDDEAARAFDLMERIGMLQKRLSSALYARAAERPFTVPDGRVFGPREKLSNLKLDGTAVWKLLREMYGSHVADAAIERKATGKKLEEALRIPQKGTLAGRKREVLAALKANGGATQETRTVVDVHDAEPAKLKPAND